MSLDQVWVLKWTELAASAAQSHREELTALDRAIGDADHGENLDRGFTAVTQALAQDVPADPAQIFRTIAMTLMSKVGGASGPLLGTAYLRMSSAAAAQMGPRELAAMIEAASAGIQARGRATQGEKTMVDAWAPASRAAQEAAESGADCVGVLQAAADAAAEGAQTTLGMVATKGRASYLGERSAGHLDPGAVSSSYLLDAALKAAQ
ncbi:MAG: dihydroxyacetone kinase subunit DhaL [Ancrocorticia sp.]|uniref:dihydroxyacetone kinase subunit DhaL n=1 Tax=Ancrocorticia sp. TaxID=2593684 RepID=UPI003F8FB59B